MKNHSRSGYLAQCNAGRINTFLGEVADTSLSAAPSPAHEQNHKNNTASACNSAGARSAPTELEILRKRAIDAEIATTSILSNISHEFRTPLNAVIGFSELLLSDAPGKLENPLHRDYIEDIHESAFRLLDMINDLLDTAEVGNGLSDLRFEQTELIDIIQQARDSVEAMSEAGNIRLVFETDCIKCGIEVDRQRFYQAIRQIFAETIRRTSPGQTITIEADTRNDDVDITLSCLPHLQGIEVTPCMSYRRNQSGVMVRDGGTVFDIDPDMTIARTVLNLLGGAVEIDNDVEGGLKVVVSLPKAQKAF